MASQLASDEIEIRLDSDSYNIAIDSCCSYSIARHRRDFLGEMTPCKIRIHEFTGGSMERNVALQYQRC